MTTVTYDSTSIISSSYNPRFVQHESVPARVLSTQSPSAADGEVLVAERYGSKHILLSGMIVGSSVADAESKIDTLKELFSRPNKNLDIDWNGSTRRYVAICVAHNFQRDHYNTNFIPWTADFLVPAGIGVDTGVTSLYDTSALTAATTNITTVYAGSAVPRPKFTINMTTVGDAAVIKLENVTTGEYIKIDGPFSNADEIIVDCATRTVTKNGTAITFRGLFPDWIVGSNSFRMTIIGSGSNADQSQTTEAGSRAVFYDNTTAFPWGAQSFVPSESGYVEKFEVIVDKEGTPGGKMQFLIYSDNNNEPGSNLCGANSYEIDDSAIGAKATETAVWTGGTRPYLTAGQRYWLVLNPNVITGSDINNFFGWYYSAGLTSYPAGKAMFRRTTSDAWTNGVANAQTNPPGGAIGEDEHCFTSYLGSGGGPSHSIRLRIAYTKRWL